MPDPQTPSVRPLTADEISAWRARLSAGREVSKDLVTQGRKEVNRVRAKTLGSAPSQHTVVVPLDYASLEQKKAQLFKIPEVIAEGDIPEAEAAAPLMSAVANKAIGPKGVNATVMMFEVQTDVLVQGYAVTKIGYENVVDGTKQVETGQMVPDPNAVPQPGAILGLGVQPPMVPETVPVPNIISETYYWRRISPGFLLGPDDFRGSDFDLAGWLAWRFCEDVPDGEKYSGSTKDDELLLSEPASSTRKTPKRWGTEVWYKASVFDPAVKHPEIVRTFKLYDDEQTEQAHRDSPFQRWSMGGQLSPSYVPGAELIGMKGYPIHVLTLRYLSDTAFPPSDTQMGGTLSEEISIGRTQVLRRRDRSLPQVLYDTTRVTDPAIIAKIERNDNTGFIGVPGPPSEMFLALDKGQFGRENFAFNDQAQKDYDKAWALGSDAGVLKGPSETATKTNDVRQSIDTRLEAERTREVEWFLAGLTKLMSLYQVFADKDDYVRILGPSGEVQFQSWNKTQVALPFTFKVRPNSHIRLDAETDFRQELDFFNLAGNAPEGNRMYMLRRLAEKRGMDPAKALQMPPVKGPDPAKGTISFKIEDFVGPGAPVAAELAAQCGFKVSPQALSAAGMFGQAWAEMQAQMAAEQPQGGQPETEHGGAMVGGGATNPINKHSADQTGGMQGLGV